MLASTSKFSDVAPANSSRMSMLAGCDGPVHWPNRRSTQLLTLCSLSLIPSAVAGKGREVFGVEKPSDRTCFECQIQVMSAPYAVAFFQPLPQAMRLRVAVSWEEIPAGTNIRHQGRVLNHDFLVSTKLFRQSLPNNLPLIK